LYSFHDWKRFNYDKKHFYIYWVALPFINAVKKNEMIDFVFSFEECFIFLILKSVCLWIYYISFSVGDLTNLYLGECATSISIFFPLAQ